MACNIQAINRSASIAEHYVVIYMEIFHLDILMDEIFKVEINEAEVKVVLVAAGKQEADTMEIKEANGKMVTI